MPRGVKTPAATISWRIRLDPKAAQRETIDDYFSQYQLAVNYYLSVIHKIRLRYVYVARRNRASTNCARCGEEGEHPWKNREEDEYLCAKCYRNLTDRKSLYAAKRGKTKRNRSDFEVRDSGAQLAGTDFARAYDIAQDNFKQQDSRRRRQETSIARLKKRIQQWWEVLDDARLTRKVDGQEEQVPARFPRPKVARQRSYRYVHYDNRESRSMGMTLSRINALIPRLEKELRRRERSLHTRPPRYKGTKVKLQNSALKNLHLSYSAAAIKLKLADGDEVIPVALPRGTGKLQDLTEAQINNPSALPNLIRRALRYWNALSELKRLVDAKKAPYCDLLKKDGKYYLNFPMSFPEVDAGAPISPIAIGIDRGVNHVAVLAAVGSPTGKPLFHRFIRGDKLIELRRMDNWIRTRIQRAKPKSKRKRLSPRRHRTRNITSIMLHKYATSILEDAVKLREDNPSRSVVFILENLKDVRFSRPATGSRKQERRIQRILGNFAYSMLQSRLAYKCAILPYTKAVDPIPLVLIDPRYTSQLCSVCLSKGTDILGDRPTQSSFECPNGHRMNADLNAAINIARIGLLSLAIKAERLSDNEVKVTQGAHKFSEDFLKRLAATALAEIDLERGQSIYLSSSEARGQVWVAEYVISEKRQS